MLEFFRSLGTAIYVLFAPRFVGVHYESYKGPKSWWIHVNHRKYKHVYLFYVDNYVGSERFKNVAFTMIGQTPVFDALAVTKELKQELTNLLNGSGVDWFFVPWSPIRTTKKHSNEEAVWVVATSSDDWLMYAKLQNSQFVDKIPYDYDRA